MRNILVVLLMSCPITLLAQQAKLNLVMGHPYPHISTQFPGKIFQLETDSLADILQFSEPMLLLENIRYYPDLNYLSVVTHEHRKREGKRVFSRVFNSDSVYLRKHEINFGTEFGSNCIKETLIKFNKKEVYDCFSCRHLKTRERKFYGINIYTGMVKEISPQDFAYSLISGSPGGALDAWDIQLLYTNPENGRLVIPKTPKIEERPPYPLVLPDSLQVGEKTRVGVHVNNDFVTAINKKIIDSNQQSIGMSHFLIFNKQTEQWHTWKVEGSSTVVRGFDEWIVGSVVGSNVKLIFDEKGRLQEKIPLNRVSPGKDKRRQQGTDTGTPFDLRADFFDLYYPGVLFLHNINTRKTIEWSTGQGDSEVLLVEDKTVYYRIDDKIYQAQIINGKKLGKPELLLKDDRVPDIHWAFFSRQ